MSVAKIGQGGQVVIPKVLRQHLGLEEGDLIEFKREKGVVVLRPKKIIDPDDVVTPAEASLLRKAQRQMRRGECITLEKLESVGWGTAKYSVRLASLCRKQNC
jgi:AbrB family looped-hinge helix DNA binding protein